MGMRKNSNFPSRFIVFFIIAQVFSKYRVFIYLISQHLFLFFPTKNLTDKINAFFQLSLQ